MPLSTTLFTLALLGVIEATEKPHIVVIVADDLGWNDVGFHGSDQIPTPNIDALAYSGIILNNYYVTPLCTPSRSALMTGKYPIHTGMQHNVLYGAEPHGLPLSETLLPEYLRDLGYMNHIVGKWHLGSWKKEYTPTYRGFLSHYGYWTGHQDYFDHTAMETGMWGLDMRRGMESVWEDHGQYSTDLFTKESIEIIHNHDAKRGPLFLYLAHAAVHSGNPYNPLPAPDAEIAKFNNITDYYRKRFAGMLSKLDESVGKVVQALNSKGILKNTIILFTTDNGGPAAGFNLNAASNWPLRGVKNTLWEGGVRGSSFIWSPRLHKYGRVSNDSIHITDWLPTLYAAADGDPSKLGEIDGINAWPSLSTGSPSGRHITLHNIDDLFGNSALTIGQWKILKGSTYKGTWDNWYGPSGRDSPGRYDPKSILHSLAGKAVTNLGLPLTLHQIKKLRSDAEVDCRSAPLNNCNPLVEPCLYNIVEDPCERNNLASKYPSILQVMEAGLKKFNATVVPPGNRPLDPAGNPKFWDHTWTNFGDLKTTIEFL